MPGTFADENFNGAGEKPGLEIWRIEVWFLIYVVVICVVYRWGYILQSLFIFCLFLILLSDKIFIMCPSFLAERFLARLLNKPVDSRSYWTGLWLVSTI